MSPKVQSPLWTAFTLPDLHLSEDTSDSASLCKVACSALGLHRARGIVLFYFLLP